MSILAIKGHPAKGAKVIEILRLLGGINTLNFAGIDKDCFYYIGGSGIIYHCSMQHNLMAFTLEEFLEKYPYKVGDKVQHKGATFCGSVYEVEKMRWEENTVKYTLRLFGCNYKTSTLSAEYLQPYKEETMNKAVFDANAQCCDIMNHLIKKETMEENLTIQDIRDNNAEWLLNKLEGMSAKKALQTISDLYDKLRKPKYPKTYVECINMFNSTVEAIDYKKIRDLNELIYCRNTYWKIAGEQMGLGKPWEPNWSLQDCKYVIVNKTGVIQMNEVSHYSRLLAFPTAEMRDTFYKNFKYLIESCRELL